MDSENIPRVYVENYDTIDNNNIMKISLEKIHLENMS